MNTFLGTLRGKKTYIASGLGALYVIGALIGLWEWDERVLAVFGLSSLAFLRAGVAKAAPVLCVSSALLLQTGCTTPERAAYQVTGATAVSVDAAMRGWGDYVRAGKASAADEAVVKRAYSGYQAAMRTARSAVLTYLDAGGADRSALDVALDALEGSRLDLLGLIETFLHPQPARP